MPYKDPEARRASARKNTRRYYAKHKAKVLAAQKNAVARADAAAKTRKYRSKRPKPDQHNEWLKRKKNEEWLAGRPRPEACEICSTTKDKIVFDHCHQRGHFRGWICVRCNKVLGLVYDDPRLLMQMAAYLQRTKVNASPQLTLSGI